ncbi:MAG: glutamate--cysteine ligase [Gammaproteobacteria bacterium]|nr:glutamate--cysteine ligase [Gammaproteobacteria bacterium]
MTQSLSQGLKRLATKPALLTDLRRGVERETLRVTARGQLAVDPHSPKLGAALTHPLITTDFSESLLEFITPVAATIEETLVTLRDIHRFVHRQLPEQRLWPMSMPCYVPSEGEIPVARYGSSNVGRMKTLYRVGLHHRYGSVMQLIAGAHYNISFSDRLWQQILGTDEPLHSAQRSACYMGLIRNFRRQAWVIPYLFGASPSLCRSFVNLKGSELPFACTPGGTCYLPYATSLRMSDLGYTNRAQARLSVDYNSLPAYLAAIEAAISTPEPTFEAIGVRVDGGYRQLNANILQIENELYAPIRPKRSLKTGETPLSALRRHGIEYVEVRTLDLDPFEPTGINPDALRFIDLLLLDCALAEPRPFAVGELAEASHNFNQVVLYGRDPQLQLTVAGIDRPLRQLLVELCQRLEPLAALMDGVSLDGGYLNALSAQHAKVLDPSLTPSARVLEAILGQDGNNKPLAMRLAENHRHYFLESGYEQLDESGFEQLARQSLAEQAAMDAQPQQPFDEFLEQYYRRAVEPA